MDGSGTSQPMTLISGEQATVVCNLLTATTPRLTPTGKISHAKTRVYTQRYRKEWEQMQDFKGWLTSVPNQPTRAYCIYCKKNLHAHRLSLLKHTCTMKHQRAALTHKMEEKKSTRKWDANALEVGLIEEVEAVDDPRTEGDEENEEEIEYVVERLEMDEEEAIETQDVKEESMELIDEEEGEKEIDDDLYTQLQSEDEEMKPVIKKVKLSTQKCRDTLAEAMAHVHSEYLEEEVEDQDDVQMEMVVESANPDVPDLSDTADDAKDTSKESTENEKTEIRANKKSTGKVLQENNKPDLVVTSSLPVLDATYHTNISSTPTQNTINLLPISPNLKSNKTITLMCGNKTFTLTGGTFQPGTQYVLTKLKGKPLMMTDQKKTIAVSEPDKIKISSPVSLASQPFQPSAGSSQQPIVNTNQQSTAASIKGGPSSKKVILGKQPIKSTATRKLRISTYVVDTTKGIPIGGLQVSLYKLIDGKWTFLNESNTNAEGYCIDLVEKVNCTIGRYKIHFDVDKYFTLRSIVTMFPFVEIVFDVKNPNGHYHMPLLLSPFGYTTYRGT